MYIVYDPIIPELRTWASICFSTLCVLQPFAWTRRPLRIEKAPWEGETTCHLRVRLVNQPSTHHQTIAVLTCLLREHACSLATSGLQCETDFFQPVFAFFSSELNIQQLVLLRGHHILCELSSVTVVHLSWKLATPPMPTLSHTSNWSWIDR